MNNHEVALHTARVGAAVPEGAPPQCNIQPTDLSVGRAVTAVAAPPARALYFGDEPLFGWYHPAGYAGRVGVGVVLCNPLGDDYVRAYRPLRHLAERLAAAGFDVLRFDFHGTGDSPADERVPGRAAAWRRDVGAAIDALRELCGVGKVALVGLRFGATLAAVAAAERGDVDSLVLWSPYPGGAAFVADAVRTHKAYRMLDPDGFASGPRVREDGEEALGFFLTREVCAELQAIDLHALTRPPALAALVVGAAAAEVRLVQHLARIGVACARQVVSPDKFLATANHLAAVPDESIDAITAWLTARYASGWLGRAAREGGASSPTPASERAVDAPPSLSARVVAGSRVEEQPLVIGEGQRLFGILTRPDPERVRPGRPAVILLNAGTVHRIGPHRLYVSMARRWAAHGFFVLRLDLSGIGDSAAPPGSLENLCYPPSFSRDIDRAMRALSATVGTERFILAGLCSGGDVSLIVGSEDRRVVSAVMMNPRTFMVNDLDEIERHQDARYYRSAILKKESWVKALRGEVDLPRAARVVIPQVKDVAWRAFKDLVGVSAHEEEAREGNPAAARLRSMVERGVDTLLVVAEHDPGVDYLDVHCGDAMRALRALKGFRREDIPGTDHTFTSRWAQEHVSDAVTSHLLQRHLAP